MNRAHRNVKITVDAAMALLCAAASVVVLVDADSPVRPALVLVALVVGTGWAATCWIDLDDVAFAATAALGTGLACLFLYGLFFVEIGWWHPVGSAGVLLAVAAAVCVAAIARDTNARDGPVKSLVANAALAIVTVATVLALVLAHEVLAALANGSERFALTRRWLAVAVAVMVLVVAVVIAARFYYLRT